MAKRNQAAALVLLALLASRAGGEEPPEDEPPEDEPPTQKRTIEVCETGGQKAEYKIVANQIEHVPGTLEDDDKRTASNAYEGVLWGKCDSFKFTGQHPTAFQWTGSQDVTATIDGEEIDLDSVSWAEPPGGGGGPVDPGPGETRGPPAGYSLVWEDHFDGNSLDTSKWSVGWGWGRETTYSPTRITPDNISVRNSKLVLEMKRHGNRNYTAGAIHTKNKFTFGPGTFMQARIRPSDLPRASTAWWAKPNTEDWPPELDMMEAPTVDGQGRDISHRTIHNLHFDHTLNCSPAPADRKGKTSNGIYAPSDVSKVADRFLNFEVLWEGDRVVTWVDGNHVGTTTHNTCMRHFRKCAPFYMMINNIAGNPNWFGVPEGINWGNYRTISECDYVRVYKN